MFSSMTCGVFDRVNGRPLLTTSRVQYSLVLTVMGGKFEMRTVSCSIRVCNNTTGVMIEDAKYCSYDSRSYQAVICMSPGMNYVRFSAVSTSVDSSIIVWSDNTVGYTNGAVSKSLKPQTRIIGLSYLVCPTADQGSSYR